MRMIIITIAFCALVSAMQAPEDPIDAKAFYDSLREGIQRRSKLDDRNAAIEGLGEYVRKLGSHLPERDPIWIGVLREATTELISIPGHAEFYAKPIWESYAAYRDSNHPKHTGSLTWFSWEIRIGMETLRHLPSPETVKVLGGMLSEEWEHQSSPDSKVDPSQSMAKYAVTAMTLLNIRDAPSAAIEQYSAPEVLSDWQAWYEQIKSGQRAFSFKGQAVEYRFKPGGTWETIPIANPPDDAPEVPEASPADKRTISQVKKESPPENAGKNFRPFLLAALAGLIALAAAWFGFRRMKSRA
jgi:hypothetical protein